MNKMPATAMPAMPLSTEAEKSPVSRRDFLTLAWKGLLGLTGMLGLGGLWRFLSYQPEPAAPTVFDLGLAEQFPPEMRSAIPEAQAVLINGKQGFRAYSLICPHLGCIVELSAEGFACPCHGSLFNPDGSLQRGPASKPLRPLTLEVNKDGHLILDTSDS